MPNKFKIGITGGIGAGNSIVSEFIEQSGFKVLRSDPIAKELMQTDEQIRKQLMQEFGNEVYSDGKLNTKYLAENVFSDNNKNEIINSIVHPPTLKKIDKLNFEILEKQNLVFVESALIYEAEFDDMFDYVILVFSDEKLRIERAVKRGNTSESEIRKRMQFQIDDDKKKDWADFVIENNSSIEDLKQRTDFILNLLTSLSK